MKLKLHNTHAHRINDMHFIIMHTKAVDSSDDDADTMKYKTAQLFAEKRKSWRARKCHRIIYFIVMNIHKNSSFFSPGFYCDADVKAH